MGVRGLPLANRRSARPGNWRLPVFAVAVVCGGLDGLRRPVIGMAVVAVPVADAGLTAGCTGVRGKSADGSAAAAAIIGGVLAGVLSAAVMGMAVQIAAVILFENSNFTW